MKFLKLFILMLVAFAAITVAQFYWRSYLQDSSSLWLGDTAPKGLQNPGSFTRIEALDRLEDLVSSLTSTFNPNPRIDKNIDYQRIPAEVYKFVLPAPGEDLVVRQDSAGADVYFITYYAEYAMPDSHSRFLDLINSNECKLLHSGANELASFVEFESATYTIRISQLAFTMDRTEVMIHASKKQ